MSRGRARVGLALKRAPRQIDGGVFLQNVPHVEKQRKIRMFLPDAYVSLDYQNQTGKVLRKKLLGIEQKEIPIHKGEPLALELRSFVDCVKNHKEPVVSGAHAAEALKLAVDICQCIRKGRS